MKEIETSGGRQVKIQLDDDDYDKIMALTVSRVYFIQKISILTVHIPYMFFKWISYQ